VSDRHPSGLDLSRYADGELDARRTRDVACHVEECVECREYVVFIQGLAAAVEDLPADEAEAPAVEAGYDLAAEVLRRRRAGDRVALAVPGADTTDADDGQQSGVRLSAAWRLGLSIAAGFVLFALAGIYLIEAPPAAAGRSELDFGTDLATPGSTLGVVYTPALFLAGQDSLRLRIRARSVNSER